MMSTPCLFLLYTTRQFYSGRKKENRVNLTHYGAEPISLDFPQMKKITSITGLRISLPDEDLQALNKIYETPPHQLTEEDLQEFIQTLNSIIELLKSQGQETQEVVNFLKQAIILIINFAPPPINKTKKEEGVEGGEEAAAAVVTAEEAERNLEQWKIFIESLNHLGRNLEAAIKEAFSQDGKALGGNIDTAWVDLRHLIAHWVNPNTIYWQIAYEIFQQNDSPFDTKKLNEFARFASAGRNKLVQFQQFLRQEFPLLSEN